MIQDIIKELYLWTNWLLSELKRLGAVAKKTHFIVEIMGRKNLCGP